MHRLAILGAILGAVLVAIFGSYAQQKLQTTAIKRLSPQFILGVLATSKNRRLDPNEDFGSAWGRHLFVWRLNSSNACTISLLAFLPFSQLTQKVS